MFRFIKYVIIILLFAPLNIQAQPFYRLKADYTIKYKDDQGKSIMQMGVVYYDTNARVIVMKNGFPVREFIVQKDTSIFQIRNNYIHARSRAYAMVELSIFHLALKGELEDYGLKKSGYSLENVKEEKGLIVTSWLPPDHMKEFVGKIMVSLKDKHLFGIVFYDVKGNIVAKHFFRDYSNINGFVFPKEVLRIQMDGTKEKSFLTNYSKISVNGLGEDEMYNYKIPTN